MEKIASFTVNHDRLDRGIYVSRIDGDVVTYDVRFKKPNGGDYLSGAAMHTIEHLLATYLRNTAEKDRVVYVGPMGCRTGFYVLLRDDVSQARALTLIRDGLRFVAAFTGEIPGSTRVECGNYTYHDLPAAQKAAREMDEVLRRRTVSDMTYRA